MDIEQACKLFGIITGFTGALFGMAVGLVLGYVAGRKDIPFTRKKLKLKRSDHFHHERKTRKPPPGL